MQLGKRSLGLKLVLLMVLSFLGTVALSAFALYQLRDSMESEFRVSVRSLVEVASGIVSHYEAQEQSGAMSREAAQAAAKAALRAVRYQGDNYFYVFDTAGRGVMHPIRKDFDGRELFGKLPYGDGRDLVTDIVASVRDRPAAFLMTQFPHPGQKEPVPKLQYLQKFAPWGWIVGSGVYMDQIDAAFWQQLMRFAAIVAGLLVVLGSVVVVIMVGITRQLGGEPAHVAALMDEAARGNLRAAQGSVHAGSLLGTLQSMLDKLRAMMERIGGGAGRLAETSRELSGIARQVADDAHQQADATSAIAAATEQMTASVKQISDHARETEDDSARAAKVAEEGEALARSAVQQIQAIASTVSEASQRIGDLVGRADEIGTIANVIKEIAAQTNLLALNAAIEAARAGEQGRGFAVVADEVRGLAERTASATVKIEQMIEGIQGETHQAVDFMGSVAAQVDQGVGKVEQAAQSLAEIRQGTTTTLERIREVAAATQEQGHASTDIAQRVESIAHMVENTTLAMDTAVQAAEKLEQLAADLHREVDRFKY